MKFVSWLLVNAGALAVALWLIPGIRLDGPDHGSEEFKHKIWRLLIVAAIFGVVNAIIRPILTIATLPAIILTLGLFILVINAALLALTAWVTGHTSLGFHVDGFWDAFFGGLIIAAASMVLRATIASVRS